MKKNRNGLLEIYRFLICFWPLYYHDFFLWRRSSEAFSGEILSINFFFMLSGFFLMRVMRREKDTPVLKGVMNIMLGRVKPLAFTMGFILAFDLVYLIFFLKENRFYELYWLVRYWWFVLFLTVAVAIFYLVYRLIKNEKIYATLLGILVVTFAVIHHLEYLNDDSWSPISYVARTVGGISLGILVSLIPKWNPKKFNYNILVVALLIPLMLYLAYIKKNYSLLVLMVLLFGALMYFSSNIPLGGTFYDLIGMLSVRMYLYMAFITVFECIGFENNIILFVTDFVLASLDVAVTYCVRLYISSKKQRA